MRYRTTAAAISINAATDNTVIAAPGTGKHLEIFHLTLIADRGYSVDVTLKNGASAISGAMDMQWLDTDFGVAPIIISDNTAFVVTLSAAVQVSGMVLYRTVDE